MSSRLCRAPRRQSYDRRHVCGIAPGLGDCSSAIVKKCEARDAKCRPVEALSKKEMRASGSCSDVFPETDSEKRRANETRKNWRNHRTMIPKRRINFVGGGIRHG